MTINNKTELYDISGTIAYLIGVDEKYMANYYEKSDTVKNLQNNSCANIIRYLNKIRTKIILNFETTEQTLIFGMKNLNYQDLYKNEIKALEKLGVELVEPNYRCNPYLIKINKLMQEHIDDIQTLFPEWLKWDYIKDLFIIPKIEKKNVVRAESIMFRDNRRLYPFCCYIHLPKLIDDGNILYCDAKFVKKLYKIHGNNFSDKSKLFDAGEDVKTNIYGFINGHEEVIVAVDCENCDPFKFASVLQQLNNEELDKIDKIILFDDVHTTSAWNYIEKLTDVPIEHNIIERVKDNKSLVDMKICAEVTKLRYQSNIKAFVLCSSDSDFWGLISSLSDTDFLVMIENAKCGPDIKRALDENKIYYCSIDDFCTTNVTSLKSRLLDNKIKARLEKINVANLNSLLKDATTELRMDATKDELANYYHKYTNNLRLKIKDDGDIKIYLVE